MDLIRCVVLFCYFSTSFCALVAAQTQKYKPTKQVDFFVSNFMKLFKESEVIQNVYQRIIDTMQIQNELFNNMVTVATLYGYANPEAMAKDIEDSMRFSDVVEFLSPESLAEVLASDVGHLLDNGNLMTVVNAAKLATSYANAIVSAILQLEPGASNGDYLVAMNKGMIDFFKKNSWNFTPENLFYLEKYFHDGMHSLKN